MPWAYLCHVLHLLVQVHPGSQGRTLEHPHPERPCSRGARPCHRENAGPLDVPLVPSHFGRVPSCRLQQERDATQVDCTICVAAVPLVQNCVTLLL